MKIHDVIQGTPEWLALRAEHNTASEASAMMGASKYQSRNQLLAMKKTGITPEINPAMQALFDKGHAAEAAARPIAERMMREELYPVTGTDGDKLASLDGMTMIGDRIWEHKLWSESLAESIRADKLEPHYYWQLEHQLLVSGADEVVFTTSDGTEENYVEMVYKPVAGRREQLIEGWAQFDKDLADFVPTVKATAIGAAPETLPALRIEVTGMVTASNLDQFKTHAMSVIESINTDLQTDQDFADAEKTVKWCKDVEDRLALAKQAALSQTATIDDLFRAIDEISESTRQTRLKLSKSVTTRKDELKLERVMAAGKAFDEHILALTETAGIVPSTSRPDFGGAIKGLRSLDSIDDKIHSTLSNAKAEATTLANTLIVNLRAIDELAKGHENLVRDRAELAYKSADDAKAIIAGRIAEAQAAIDRAVQAEAERNRLRQEAIERAAQEAAAVEQARIDAEAAKVVIAEIKAEAGFTEIEPTAAPVKQARPTAEQIINLVASIYKVSVETARGWINQINSMEKAA